MKKISTLLVFIAFAFLVNAQINFPFTFEADKADTSWIIFANGPSEVDSIDLSIVENPSKNEVNMSDSVLQFIVHPDASAWVGMYTDYLEEEIAFTEDAHTLTMMVYKTIISPCAMKIELSSNGGANKELKVDNTLTDEWELLTFDMSTAIGYIYTRLTVFPDFPATRTEGTVVLMDNFSSPGTPISVKQFAGVKTIVYPNPATDRLFIQHPSMYSYTISNLLGRQVKTLQFQSANSKFIDVSEMQPGIYLISVESATGNYTSKFIKK